MTNFSGSEYSIDELDLVRWLRTCGELLSSIIEKPHEDSDRSSPIGARTYTVENEVEETNSTISANIWEKIDNLLLWNRQSLLQMLWNAFKKEMQK